MLPSIVATRSTIRSAGLVGEQQITPASLDDHFERVTLSTRAKSRKQQITAGMADHIGFDNKIINNDV